MSSGRPLTVAWISYFPIEWLPDPPAEIRQLPKQHPATWQQVLAQEFSATQGLELHVFAFRKLLPRTVSFRASNITYHCYKVPRGTRTLSLFWWETLLIRRKLRQIRPDMVHAWGSERAAALVASRLPFPYLVSMQGLLQWYQQQSRQPGWLPALEARLEHTALRKARVVSAEARFSVNWLRQYYPHLDVRLIEHGPSWIFHRVERRPKTDPIRLVFLGGVNERKGCDLLFDGLELAKDSLHFELVVIGGVSPSFQPRVDQVSPELRRRITFKQGLTPAEVASELACATIALCPSKADTGPVAVKEQTAAGVPVIGSVMGGIPDYVVPEKNGFLFESGDVQGFVTALKNAFAHPLFSRGEVDRDTLAKVRERLSPAKMAGDFLSVYHELVRR